MKTSFILPFALALTGCGGAPDDGPIGVAESAALNLNALNLNALNLNALNLNALNLNALEAGALDGASLAALTDPGPNGDLARQLARYAASCALGPGQSFSFAWTDPLGVPHVELDAGLLGLAPAWAQRGLTVAEGRWVSACLASRVNWYQIPVWLSSRGPSRALDRVTGAELAGYPVLEGAFWADLFASSPYAYACDDPADVGIARALQRDCAAGHLDAQGNIQGCGMIQLAGPCSAACGRFISNPGFYTACADPQGNSTGQVVTTFLQ